MTGKRPRKDDEDARRIKRGEMVPSISAEEYSRIHARIVYLWDKGTVTIHAADQAEERAFDYLDIQNCILRGKVVEHQPQRDAFRFVVEGQSTEGEPMRCAVEINGELVVVTVMRI